MTRHDIETDKKLARRNGGFSMLELVVTIVVFGILCGMAVVNWSSFVRHQELRSEALNLHREIVAQRAKALEAGDTVKVVCLEGASVCTVRVHTQEEDPATGNFTPKWLPPRLVNLAKGAVVTQNPGPVTTMPNDWVNPTPTPPNNWNGGTITIEPENLKAYKDDGWVIVTRLDRRDRGEFLIMVRNANSIRPELYHRKGSGTWRKM